MPEYKTDAEHLDGILKAIAREGAERIVEVRKTGAERVVVTEAIEPRLETR